MTLVIGVMSTYMPDLDVTIRARDHLSQLDQLIIVDDGSTDAGALEAITDERITVVRLEKNSGIAHALNVGTKRALESGAEWVLYLDQDTLLTPNFVERCLSLFNIANQTTRVGIVVSDYVNESPSLPPRYSPEGFGLVDEGIQSGMMISKSCINEIGQLDERLFIDCVDTEYCLRAIDFGWRIAVAPKTKIVHSLGTQMQFAPFGEKRFKDGKPIFFQYHPPFREYYIVRNNVDLCFRNIKLRPRWVVSVVRREINPQIQIFLGGPSPLKHLLCVTIGFVHGVFRRRGKIPNWLFKIVS